MAILAGRKWLNRLLAVLTTCAFLLFSPARAGDVEIAIDSSLADYILETACSGDEVDEERLRNSKILKAQIDHHSGNSAKYSMDAYIDGLKAAARCEVLKDDIFRFRYVVEDRKQMKKAIAFLKSKEDELAAYVAETTAPYFPEGKSFKGQVVLSAAGQSCGGFSWNGAFFIDVPCVAENVKDEFEAIRILSAHETYHALQFEFFAPFDEHMEPVDTPEEAQNYLFQTLLIEGTAEYVADSRDVPGAGTLATLFRDFAAKGHRRVSYNLGMLGYAAEILGAEEDSNRRIRDVYTYGFSGNFGQQFYYVGAAMAKEIETAFGREALVCVMGLSPEQFALAYDNAAGREESEAFPIGAGAVNAATKLGKGRTSYETCI